MRRVQAFRSPFQCLYVFLQCHVPSPASVAVVAFLLLCGIPSFGQKGNEKTFASPGDAALALYNAAKTHDGQKLKDIFGAKADTVLHTGDDTADENTIRNFVGRYEQMRRVVIEPDQTATLYIGTENWPLPIPIVKTSTGSWYFDTEAGEKEILQRRVGTNENDAIEVLYTLVDAQHDYASEVRDGAKAKHYALKFLSDEGKHNGLYWKTNENEPASPIGPLLAAAARENYSTRQGQPTPFHGYYYRILGNENTSAKSFSFVAYPAEYRNSGVMTFVVNQTGVIYQKDLGPETSAIAAAMNEIRIDRTWEKVD